MDFCCFKTERNMTVAADGNNRVSTKNPSRLFPVFPLKSICLLYSTLGKLRFGLFCFHHCRPDFDKGETERGRRTSVIVSVRCLYRHSDDLISIYECIPDAAFKMPSTQHLTTASLCRAMLPLY